MFANGTASHESFAALLRAEMAAFGWSPTQLWREVQAHASEGVSRQTVWNWQRGQALPLDRHRPALWAAFGWGAHEQARAAALIAADAVRT